MSIANVRCASATGRATGSVPTMAELRAHLRGPGEAHCPEPVRELRMSAVRSARPRGRGQVPMILRIEAEAGHRRWRIEVHLAALGASMSRL